MHLPSRCYIRYKHRRNRANAQGEPADTLFMSLLHHPMAPEYRSIRHLYDSLPYACGRSQRYLSYRNRKNHTILGRPELLMSADRVFRHSMTERSWQHCVEHAAIAGWPQAYAPEIHRGQIWVCSEDREFATALAPLLDRKAEAGNYPRGAILCAENLSAAQYLDVIKIVAEFEGADLLTSVRTYLEELAEHVRRAEQAGAAGYGYICPPLGASGQAQDRLAIDYEALAASSRRKDTWI